MRRLEGLDLCRRPGSQRHQQPGATVRAGRRAGGGDPNGSGSTGNLCERHRAGHAEDRAGTRLDNILSRWTREADTALRIQLVHALGDSRLFDEAELVALAPGTADAVR